MTRVYSSYLVDLLQFVQYTIVHLSTFLSGECVLGSVFSHSQPFHVKSASDIFQSWFRFHLPACCLKIQTTFYRHKIISSKTYCSLMKFIRLFLLTLFTTPWCKIDTMMKLYFNRKMCRRPSQFSYFITLKMFIDIHSPEESKGRSATISIIQV